MRAPSLLRSLSFFAPLLLAAACAGNADKGEEDLDEDGDGSPASLDCNDGDASIYPGASEICDSIDQDCDAVVDNDPVDGATFFTDVDGDGFGLAGTETVACADTNELAANDLDCADEDAAIFPGAEEVCDGVDNDCNGDIDSDATDRSVYYLDNDGDTYGDPEEEVLSCTLTAGLSDNNLDCDDNNPRQNPDSIWYPDVDEDGYGDQAAGVVVCEQPAGSILIGGDCDDTKEEINPEVDEVCDTVDNNCDGEVDEDTAVDASIWYEDADLDGYGLGSATVVACEAPEGLTDKDGDCNDADDTIYPWAPETCADDIDQDCNGIADNTCHHEMSLGDAGVTLLGARTFSYTGFALDAGDFDGDGVPELVVGAYADTGSASSSGAVYVVDSAGLSGSYDIDDQAEATLIGEASGDYAGYSLTTMPDVDGDGNDELVVGAYNNDDGASAAGSVYVVPGPLSGTISLSGETQIMGLASSGYFSQYVMNAHEDLSGDGVADLLVSAAGYPSSSKHTLYVFNGPITADTDTSTADVVVTGSTYGYSAYGSSVGDVDGDGQADLLAGQPGLDAGYVAWIKGPLSTASTIASADVTLEGEAEEDFFGSLVAAGDVDGDGYADVAVGAKYESTGATDAGAIYLFAGTADGPELDYQLKMYSSSSTDYLGHQTDSLHLSDMNGDGAEDLLIGWSGCDEKVSNGGAAFLLFGPMGGTLTTSQADVAWYGTTSELGLGKGVSSVDVDGDGAADPMLGGWRASSNYGAVYLFDGASLFSSL